MNDYEPKAGTNGFDGSDLIREQSALAAKELCEAAKLKAGDLFVIGCSSSEVLGAKIGTATNTDIAEAIFEGVMRELTPRGIFLAGQCCEHLNRALVVEYEAMEKFRLDQVNAIPQPNHAGGAFATVCYRKMKEPVLVESLKAQACAGIDIGGTLIGMHIHHVAVPVRLSVKQIGEAGLICARRRIPYTGGQRAIYDERLL